VLLGDLDPAGTSIAGPGGITGHGVTLECAARCRVIDRTGRAVVLEDGRRIPYDALVLATGATARELPLLPIGTPHVHYLRSEADARALKATLGTCRALLVVGGGLIGLEVAASAATLGVNVTVLEVAPRILARVCDEQTAAAVHAAHVERGVQIRTSTALASVARDEAGRIVATTADGERFIADAVVVGTGSRPDDALAAASGLETNDGIVVDAHCRTSDPAIYAAGDCTRFPGPHGPVRLENWIHAQEQGSVAGRNAAGANETYNPTPSFWSEQYDLYIQGIGWTTAGSAPVYRARPDGRSLVFDVKDGCVVAAMGINAQRDLAVARRLIERRIAIDPTVLADPAQQLNALLKK
jgi:NADPH-dependent 2,4-dienoyl-CoA reductase/sulfur reductase-like enzyme